MIVRRPHTSHYVVIDNRVLEDARLSWKSRGILAWLLAKPDGWKVSVRGLAAAGPDGRTAIQSALMELEEYGYIERRGMSHDDAGRFDSADTIVREEPTDGFPEQGDADPAPCSEEAQCARLPFADNLPADGTPRVSNKEVSTQDLTTSRARATAKTTAQVSNDFTEAWEHYPRKLARAAALNAYRAARRKGATAADLLEATMRYAAERRGEDPKFTLYGATFYGPSERWKDYLGNAPAAQERRDPNDGPSWGNLSRDM